MIKVGQKVKFNPFKGLHSVGDISSTENTEGVVKFVHERNRWFSVEYGDDVKLRISYNFNDIGKDVRLC